jgi:hypothetical protein
VVLGSWLVVPVGGLSFAAQLPRLRRHARPVCVRLGILSAAAGGDLGAAVPVAADRN